MKKEIYGLLLLLASSSFAEDLTLKSALNYAEKRNTQIVEKKLEKENSSLELDNSKLERLASFDWASSFTKEEDSDSYSHSISLKQDLYKGNAIAAGIEKSKLELEKSELELLNEIENVKLNITEYYMNSLKYQNQLEIYIASLKELEFQYKKLRVLYENRSISKSELLELEAEIIEMESNIIEVKNSLKIEIGKLKLEMQYEGSESLKLIMPDLSGMDRDYTSDLESLRKNNLSIKMIELDESISKQNIQIKKADYLPDLDFSFKYESSDEEMAASFGEWNWEASLSFSYELFDWGETKNEIEILRNNHKIQQLEKEELIKETELDLLTKALDLEKLLEQIKAQKKLIQAREEKFKIDKFKYEHKFIDTSSFISSKNDVLSSKLGLVNLETEYYIAYREYQNTKR